MVLLRFPLGDTWNGKESSLAGKSVVIKSYGKINLVLDVLGLLPNGYHRVDMVMQQVELHDSVQVTLRKDSKDIRITTNHSRLPVDSRNLAYGAAQHMKEIMGYSKGMDIHLEKRIPLSSGLAGGSGNGAAVMLALDHLLEGEHNLDELLKLAQLLGSDVPFSLLGQIAGNSFLHENFPEDERPCHCAHATGTGTQLRPLDGLDCWVVLVTPEVEVSTREIYDGWDEMMEKPSFPSQGFLEGLREKNWEKLQQNMGNGLEIVAGKKYPIIVYARNMLESLGGHRGTQMSGSGPTIFGLYEEESVAKKVMLHMEKAFERVFLTHTTTAGL